MNSYLADMDNHINEAYALFGHYKPSHPLDVCLQCCVTENEERLLRESDLHSLSSTLLCQWNDSAKTEKPNFNEFKYFLPRLLELAYQFDWPSHSIEISLKSFRYYSVDEWSDQELDLFDRYSKTYIKFCLSHKNLLEEGIGFDSILILLSYMPIQVGSLLEIWLQDKSLHSVQQFIEFASWIEFSKDMKFTNAFANDALQKDVREWLSDGLVLKTFMNRIENFILCSDGLTSEQVTSLNLSYEILSMNAQDYI